MKVEFQQEVYFVNEFDGSVEVCTILCGEIEREVTLNLSKTQEAGIRINFCCIQTLYIQYLSTCV